MTLALKEERTILRELPNGTDFQTAHLLLSHIKETLISLFLTLGDARRIHHFVLDHFFQHWWKRRHLAGPECVQRIGHRLLVFERMHYWPKRETSRKGAQAQHKRAKRCRRRDNWEERKKQEQTCV